MQHAATWSARAIPFAAVFVYLSLPRLYQRIAGVQADNSSTALQLSLSVLLVAILFGLRELLAQRSRAVANGSLFIAVQGIFLIRAFEAALLVSLGFGFSALVFSHASWEAARVALVDYAPLAIASLGTFAAFSWPLAVLLRRIPQPPLYPPSITVGATALLLSLLLALPATGSRTIDSLPLYRLARSLIDYRSDSELPVLDLSKGELRVLEEFGIHLEDELRYPVLASVPKQPLNLILILLESYQNNFTAAGDSPFPDLTPNIDQLLGRMTWVSRAYNPVTPTIISMTSILCGVIPPISPDYANETVYRSLRCLPDLLREVGYRQVFMGAALKTFTSKNVLLEQHSYDEVYGDEDFDQIEEYAKAKQTSWGVHDTHLVRETLRKLEELKDGPPFNLTLLTINSHKPGYISPFCPTYELGNRYLNGIHCTDFAIGKLFRGIDALGLWEKSVVILAGDHMAFPTPDTVRDLGSDVSNNYFGNVFMAIHSPRLDLPREIDILTHLPDVAPTALDLLGFQLAVPFQLGKSILGERRNIQHLVGPETEIFKGEFYPRKRKYLASEHCDELLLKATRLRDSKVLQTPCQRYRLMTRVDAWLRADEATGRPPHPPIPRDRAE